MTPNPFGRRPKILKPDPVTQLGAEKEKILKEMKEELAKLGIVVRIKMPGDTVMELTPEHALDHLAEKNCPHEITDFLDRMSRVEHIFNIFGAVHVTQKMVELQTKAKGDCGTNSQPN